MVTWGVVSAAKALVQGATSFYVPRFLLGAAEAGFFPGIILCRARKERLPRPNRKPNPLRTR